METTILIADDEPLNLLLYSGMLKSAGYSVLETKDGSEAVEMAINDLPNLIILDWNMPRTDGLSALKILKETPKTREIPVVMITGIMTSPENLQAALEAGAIDFLRKPFDKIELIARINSILTYTASKNELNEKYIEIEENHLFIHRLMESIPHPMVYFNLEGLIIGFNHYFEVVTEMTREQLLNTPIYKSWFYLQGGQNWESDKKFLTNPSTPSYETGCMLNGIDYLLSKTLFYDREHNPQGILCVMTNIFELKKAHNELMENKKKELTSSALRLIHLSELNNKLISELEEVNQYTNKKGTELIRSIISKFNIQSNNSFWNEFESRFENVYESFYLKLNQQFPDITPGERKLCALLRLNLTSKDIAALTFQNSQSVDVARYRLRKKMNLSQEENLTDFLMSL